MSPSPHTIGAGQTLETALQLMRAHKIRHLPVLKGGKLVGIVSQRDIHFIETLDGVDPETVTVDEAMTPDPFVVLPTTSLVEVAAQMAAHKYGAVLVAKRGRVVGVFTTVDALHALLLVGTPQRATIKNTTTAKARGTVPVRSARPRPRRARGT